MRIPAFCILLLAMTCSAADLAGTWKVEQTGRNGQKRVTTYVFKTRGETFTGLVATATEQRDILNGVIRQNQITFDTHFEFYEPGRIESYKGELSGDQLTISPANPPQGARGATPFVLQKISGETVYTPPPELARIHKPFPPFRPIPTNGLAQTPPMGWNSWNKFAGKIDDRTVREIADAIVSSGMRDAGYVYINIDDTWEGGRDANGVLEPNQKFPDMKALADYLHAKGLRLGIYSGPGHKTCAGFEASYGHEEQDAKTWAEWGIDYLKYDWCSASAVYHRDEMEPAYQKMALALRATGRPIIFSLCQYGWLDVGTWGAAAGGNLWRTTGDIQDNWESMSRIGFGQDGREKVAGPGHWNDPDMLEIGNGGMTDAEYRTHFSLWSLLAAPLIAGHDVRAMTEATKQILTNQEVVAIDQDKLGAQGFRVRKDGDLEVWKKPLSDGMAVGLFNRGGDARRITVNWAEMGVAAASPNVRDLWAHHDVAAGTEFATEVPAHGVVLVKIQ
jgi:alpha-galactosidase